MAHVKWVRIVNTQKFIYNGVHRVHSHGEVNVHTYTFLMIKFIYTDSSVIEVRVSEGVNLTKFTRITSITRIHP